MLFVYPLRLHHNIKSVVVLRASLVREKSILCYSEIVSLSSKYTEQKKKESTFVITAIS